MPAFDTDALVALFDEAHPHHKEARDEFLQADAVLLHPCVISEFTTVVRRLAKDAQQDGAAVARQTLHALLQQPRVSITRNIGYEDAIQLYTVAPNLSFTDAVVSEMRAWGDKKFPVTFDKNIEASYKLGEEIRQKRFKAFVANSSGGLPPAAMVRAWQKARSEGKTP
jgi:predicted nucleic acid-binding protein